MQEIDVRFSPGDASLDLLACSFCVPISDAHSPIAYAIVSDKLDQPADVDYTCTNMTFPDNKTLYNELLIHSSNLDPYATIFNPHSSQTLIGKTSCLNLTNENADNIYSILNDIRVNNSHRVILGHPNINSIRNKFDALSDIIKNKIDIMLISETKINGSFPYSIFTIDGYTLPYRKDRTNMGGGIILYIRDDIPSKELKAISLSEDKEYIY